MKKSIITAALLLSAPAYAWLGDDPAVTACESITKETIATPKSYERTKASVEGHKVIITFNAANIFNAPVRSSFECAFAPNLNGDFVLTDDEGNNDAAELNNIRVLLGAARTERELSLLRIQETAITLKIRNSDDAYTKQLTIIDELGIKPIRASKTELRAKPQEDNSVVLKKMLEQQKQRQCPAIIDTYNSFRRGSNPLPPTPFQTTAKFKNEVEDCAIWLSIHADMKYKVTDTGAFLMP